MHVIKPPESPAKAWVHAGNIVFLAGSIEMGKADNWQDQLIYGVSHLTEGTILNPRRDDWDPTWKQEITNPQFVEQVNWELEGLEVADIIAFYFQPDTMSPISLLELGLVAKSTYKDILVCCPEGFWRKGNVDIICKKYGIPTVKSLNSLIKAVGAAL